MKFADGCEVCCNIPDFAAANLLEGESLPGAVADLVDPYPSPEGFWDASKEYEVTKQCPQCGQLYKYHYYYEFSVGYVEESVWIETPKEVELAAIEIIRSAQAD